MREVVILNESERIRSEAEVDFLLDALMRGSAVPPELREQAFRIWSEEPELTHSGLTKRLVKYTKTRRKENEQAAKEAKKAVKKKGIWKWFGGASQVAPGPDDLWASLEQRLTAHQEEAASASKAYSPKEKPNPSAVFWPNPTSADRPSTLFGTAAWVIRHGFIDRSTKIGSAGSCFAMEIAHWLQKNNFNYFVTEQVKPHDPHPTPIANARWGIIFNAPSLCQLVQRAFGEKQTPKVVWTDVRDGQEKFFDPFREDVIFNSIEEYEADYDVHVAATRKALQEVDVFIMTLGMNEVWFLKNGNHALSRAPWRVASSCVEQRVLTVDENVKELEKMWTTWKKFNPKLKLILTVSPVPLHATFRADTHHIVVANAHSKATLRVAAEKFVAAHEDVHYFPAYETVMHCTEHVWEADQRHVSRSAVENVMRVFQQMFVKADA